MGENKKHLSVRTVIRFLKIEKETEMFFIMLHNRTSCLSVIFVFDFYSMKRSAQRDFVLST